MKIPVSDITTNKEGFVIKNTSVTYECMYMYMILFVEKKHWYKNNRIFKSRA